MNKYIAEFIGTMILVFFGTGTSVNPARALAPAVFHRAWFSVKED